MTPYDAMVKLIDECAAAVRRAEKAEAALSASQAREERLREALHTYGECRPFCKRQSAYNAKCVCGFGAALAEEGNP